MASSRLLSSSGKGKVRLDVRLHQDGLAESRQQAMRMVMAGVVRVNDHPVTQAGSMVRPSDRVVALRPAHPWVGRGGVKLDYALEQSGWSVQDLVALDIGASTGGFTDVLLSRGARRVFAVDVGHDQLHWKIRSHPKVTVHEKLNARYLGKEHIPQPVDIIVCDVSFISATMVLPPAMELITLSSKPSDFQPDNDNNDNNDNNGQPRAIVLVKPQFELPKNRVGRGGIVRDADAHADACQRIDDFFTQSGWRVSHWLTSPINGAKGNREFLACAQRCLPP